jgi:Sec-independent protein translocase protein TatA
MQVDQVGHSQKEMKKHAYNVKADDEQDQPEADTREKDNVQSMLLDKANNIQDNLNPLFIQMPCSLPFNLSN